MAEIRYHRVSSMKSRIESVILYVPDVWSCVPTASNWETIVQSYLSQPSSDQAEADPEAKASTTNLLLLLNIFSYCTFLNNFTFSSKNLFDPGIFTFSIKIFILLNEFILLFFISLGGRPNYGGNG